MVPPGETPPDAVAPETASPDPVLSPPPEPWAERTLASLSLRQRVAQMIMPFVLGDYAPEGSDGHDLILEMLEEQEVGGLIVSVGSPTDVAVKLNDFQGHSRLPLLVGADMETGVGFRLKGAVYLPSNISMGGATEFPPPMAIGATGDARLAYEMGRITALESRAVGVHVPFAPVLDVNSNPDNPIINTRSFGETPAEVARLGSAFIRGVQEHGAIATAKHFPGHGDTEADSHLELPVIRSDRAHLDSVELAPFRAAISAGVGAIMTAHIAVPALNGGSEMPSTLAPEVLTELLRDEMGFEGLVFTDAMDMAAIDRRFPRGEASVRAVLAGADVLLMPPNVAEAIDGIVDAVREGRISEERIDHRLPHIVGIPAHEAVADEVARRAVTLLRNDGDLLPLLGTRSARVLSVSLRRRSDLQAGRVFNGALRSRYPGLATAEVDRETRADVFDELLRQARRSNLVIVSLYVNWTSTFADEPLSEETIDFLAGLAEAGIPHVVVSFGNPYLLREIPATRAYMLAWSGSEATQRAAAGALFGDTPLVGLTPIQLPPFFSIGDGLSPAPAAGGR
jgi:beta-N-acetylhexosaminidase